MTDQDKSRDSLLAELGDLRQRVAELEKRLGAESPVQPAKGADALLFHELADKAPIGICIVQGSDFVYVNQALADFSELSTAKLLSMKFWEMVHPDYQELIKQRAASRQAGESVPETYESKFLTASGKVRWAEFSGTTIDYNGSPAILGIIQDISKRKSAQDAMTDSEEKYRSLVENTHDAIFTVDYDGKFLFMNRIAADRFGGTPEQLVGKTQWDLFPQAAADHQMKSIRSVIDDGISISIQSPTMIGDEEHHFHTTLHPLTDSTGKTVAAMGVARNITDQVKRLKQERIEGELFKALVDNSPLGISIRSNTGQLLKANDAWKTTWAMTDEAVRQDLEEKRPKLTFDARDDYLGQWKDKLVQIYQRGGSLHIPERLIANHRSGEPRWVSQYFYAIMDDDGSVDRVIILTEDITKRKQTEARLASSERKHRELLESLPVGVFQTSPDGQVLSGNPALAEMFGCDSVEEYLSLPARESFANPEQRDELLRLALRDKLVKNYEVQMKRKDGSYFWVSLTGRAVYDDAGHIAHFDGVEVDITERKQAEDALRHSGEMMRALLNAPSQSLFLMDTEATVLAANEATARNLGTTVEDLLGACISDWFPPSLAGKRKARTDEVIRSGRPRQFEDTDGERVFENQVYPVFNDDHQVIAIAVYSMDITERRQAEEALIANEAKYRNLFENAQVGMVRSDIETGKVLAINQSLADILGYTINELLQMPGPVGWHDPRDRKKFVEALQRDGQVVNFEADVHTKTGEVRTVLMSTRLFPEEGFAEGTVVDITDRKKAQRALHASEAKYRNFFDNALVGMFRTTLDGSRFLAVNRRLAELFGRDCDELLGSSPVEGWVNPAKRKEMIAQLRAEGSLDNFETKVFNSKGEERDISISIRLFADAGYLEGTLVDITERKIVEQAIKESQANLSAIVENTSDFILLSDTNGCPIYFNSAYAKVMKELLGIEIKPGLKPHTLLPDPEDRAVWDEYHRRVLSGESFAVEHQAPDPERGTRYFETSYTPVHEGDIIKGFCEYTHEVTEKKIAAEALRTSQAELSAVLENTHNVIVLCDNQGRLVYFNSAFRKAMREVIGAEVELGMPANDLIQDPVERARWDDCHRRALAGERFNYEHSWETPGRTTRHFETSFFPIYDGETVRGFSQFTQETTERKIAANALQESEAKFRRIAERSIDAIIMTDLTGTLTFASAAAAELFGTNPEDAVGHNISEFVPESELATIARGFAEIAQGRNVEGLQLQTKRLDGKTTYVEVNATPIIKNGRVVGNQAIVRDVSERKQAEQLLEQAYDDQSKQLRQVAGGLAHDIYNDLFPVTASLHKLRKQLTANPPDDAERIFKLMNLMDRAVSRTISLTESVGLYSKLQKIEVTQATPLATVFEDILRQNHDRIREVGASLQVDIPKAISVACPSVQTFYLFNNLVLNALDAVGESETREISVKSTTKGDYVLIKVQDSGSGIDPEAISSVFDPFFSTKPLSGIGLGLAIVKRIVDLCGGQIELESSLDKGTTFTIILPGDVGTSS